MENLASSGRMLSQKPRNILMPPRFSNAQRGLSIVGFGVDIGPMLQQQFQNSQVPVCRGGKQRRVSRSVAVVDVRAVPEKKRGDGFVSACNSTGQRRVSRPIGRDRIHIRAFRAKIFHRVSMPKHRGQRENRKTVRGVASRRRRILIHDLLYTAERPRRGRLVQFQGNTPCQQHISNFPPSALHCGHPRREAPLVLGGHEFRLLFQQGDYLCAVPCAHRRKKAFRHAHTVTLLRRTARPENICSISIGTKMTVYDATADFCAG